MQYVQIFSFASLRAADSWRPKLTAIMKSAGWLGLTFLLCLLSDP